MFTFELPFHKPWKDLACGMFHVEQICIPDGTIEERVRRVDLVRVTISWKATRYAEGQCGS